MVCAPLSAKIRQGERVCLSGRNGCGKSSLLKVIMGEQIAHTGTVELASGLVISCVPQDASFLCGLPGAYAKQLGIDESLFKAVLRKMGFSRSQFEKRVEDFSAGQKRKSDGTHHAYGVVHHSARNCRRRENNTRQPEKNCRCRHDQSSRAGIGFANGTTGFGQ